VVSAADFATEMRPIEHYANVRAVTGRSDLGLAPGPRSSTTCSSGRSVRPASWRHTTRPQPSRSRTPRCRCGNCL